jgi:hypothetical protein
MAINNRTSFFKRDSRGFDFVQIDESGDYGFAGGPARTALPEVEALNRAEDGTRREKNILRRGILIHW